MDLFRGEALRWSLAVVLLLLALLAWLAHSGRLSRQEARWALWGGFVVVMLGGVEYTVEWKRQTLLRPDQSRALSAANAEHVRQHVIRAKEGLFRTSARIGEAEVEMLLDTGASLVLLGWEAAQRAGLDTGALRFDEPVVTAAGPMQVARIVLPSLAVGRIRLESVEAAVAPPGAEVSNLLGASFLSRLESVSLRGDVALLRQ